MAAGSPILAEEHVEDYVPFPAKGRPEDYFALRVRGESMLGAGIYPGDLVVVHRQVEAELGEIVVALFADEATVKTFSRRDGRVWLLPANPDPDPGEGGGPHPAVLSPQAQAPGLRLCFPLTGGRGVIE